jgi:hypothetical protein
MHQHIRGLLIACAAAASCGVPLGWRKMLLLNAHLVVHHMLITCHIIYAAADCTFISSYSCSCSDRVSAIAAAA